MTPRGISAAEAAATAALSRSMNAALSAPHATLFNLPLTIPSPLIVFKILLVCSSLFFVISTMCIAAFTPINGSVVINIFSSPTANDTARTGWSN